MSSTTTTPSGILIPFDYAAQWLQEEPPTELALPSGKKVQVRMPDLLAMVKTGLIPDQLTPIVEAYIFEKEKTVARVNAVDQPAGQRLKGYADYMKYVDVITVGACVNPVVRFVPKRGEIAVDRFSTADRIAIWKWTEGITEELATFPDGADGAGADVPPVADGAGVGTAPEPAGGTAPDA